MTHAILDLAKQFVDATVNKWGSDEEAVYEVLQEVHDSHQTADFEASVYSLLSPGEKKDFKLPNIQGRLIPALLSKELSRSELARANDIYALGHDTYGSDKWEYFVDGATSLSDFSSTKSKLALAGGLAGGIVVLGVLAVTMTVAPPLALVVAVTIAVPTAVTALGYGTFKVAKNLTEIALADTDAESKQNIRELTALW